ncbi:MAG: hypothetical protein ACYCO3_16805, partial [Mycobacteriales bacterium]
VKGSDEPRLNCSPRTWVPIGVEAAGVESAGVETVGVETVGVRLNCSPSTATEIGEGVSCGFGVGPVQCDPVQTGGGGGVQCAPVQLGGGGVQCDPVQLGGGGVQCDPWQLGGGGVQFDPWQLGGGGVQLLVHLGVGVVQPVCAGLVFPMPWLVLHS